MCPSNIIRSLVQLSQLSLQ